jgi:hypothetical protein
MEASKMRSYAFVTWRAREKKPSAENQLSSGECVETHSHHQDGDGGSVSYSRVVGSRSIA